MIYSNGEVACDFLSYLECRLGMKRDATAEMLGEWLTSYKSERAVSAGPRMPGLSERALNEAGVAFQLDC